MVNTPDRAVRFGETVERGLEEQKIFPFFYSFVNAENDAWLPNCPLAGNLAGIGPGIAPGATVELPIRLDPDYAFKLFSLRYTVYTINPRVGAGIYEWYEAPAVWFLENDTFAIGTQYLWYICVTLRNGTDGRYFYGGSRTDLYSGVNAENPYRVLNTQGNLEGVGTIRTGHWLPRSGLVVLTITNIHMTDTIYVGGMLSGMKVRL
jgi:hypothetical protein